jgi:hypothetical protein
MVISLLLMNVMNWMNWISACKTAATIAEKQTPRTGRGVQAIVCLVYDGVVFRELDRNPAPSVLPSTRTA